MGSSTLERLGKRISPPRLYPNAFASLLWPNIPTPCELSNVHWYVAVKGLQKIESEVYDKVEQKLTCFFFAKRERIYELLRTLADGNRLLAKTSAGRTQPLYRVTPCCDDM